MMKTFWTTLNMFNDLKCCSPCTGVSLLRGLRPSLSVEGGVDLVAGYVGVMLGRLLLGNALVVIDHNLPSLRRHETRGRRVTCPGQGSHLRSADEEEVILALWVVEVHRFLELIVGSHTEWYNLQLSQSRRHCQYLNDAATQTTAACGERSCDFIHTLESKESRVTLYEGRSISNENRCIRLKKTHIQ